MMRVPAKARVLLTATVLLGLGICTVAVASLDRTVFPAVALLAAAVVLTELFEVARAEDSEDPEHTQAFSFSSGVHIGAVLIAGPLPAALVAAFGVVAVDGLRGQRPTKVLFNASGFALASALGGFAYVAAGGEPGTLNLPEDLVAIGLLALTYSGLNLGLVTMIISFTTANHAWRTLHQSFWSFLPSTLSEAGLGLLLALCAFEETWAVAALLPLLFSVYLAHARLALLRRETAHALETLANVIDERDPGTYRHSTRVAEHVRDLARALRLPPAEAARLEAAGRLHDLGKVSVDAAVLRKPGKLTGEQWDAMRRHARLSARLLGSFRFAAGQARAVEYHHERYDGRGYYGIEGSAIPLASHVLIVADSFDAMCSDRPYRKGLGQAAALQELERGAGSQFHPAVVKAFVAVQRGSDPIEVLSRAEYDELRRLSLRQPKARRLVTVSPEFVGVGGLSVGLAAGGLGHPLAAVAGLSVAGLAFAVRVLRERRATRLAAELSKVEDLAGLMRRLGTSEPVRWAGIVDWRERELAGSLVSASGDAEAAPSEKALTSWLISDAGKRVLSCSGEELGRSGFLVAVPVERERAVVAYVVVAFDRAPAWHVHSALRSLDVARLAAPAGGDGRLQLAEVS
jgi:HD-GYP domain-containing protein (c-di-GMP phosphodiesterase class II)